MVGMEFQGLLEGLHGFPPVAELLSDKTELIVRIDELPVGLDGIAEFNFGFPVFLLLQVFLATLIELLLRNFGILCASSGKKRER